MKILRHNERPSRQVLKLCFSIFFSYRVVYKHKEDLLYKHIRKTHPMQLAKQLRMT